jgi:NAD(P)-dependent dehydrogenase (short-subunit alcohol dehydrogenase family)
MTDVAVVGGGSGALGRAVCTRLVAGGWSVLVPVRREVQPPLPDGVVAVRCDLAEAEAGARIGAVAAEHGSWRGVVSCLGGFAAGAAHEVGEDEVRAQIEGNLLAPWRLMRAAAISMIAGGVHGRMVLVASRAAVDVAAGQAAYQVTKAAALRLAEVMAAELAEHRIGVDAVLPGTIDTPANRAAMPKADPGKWLPLTEVAEVIAGLLADEPSITGRAVVLPPMSG